MSQLPEESAVSPRRGCTVEDARTSADAKPQQRVLAAVWHGPIGVILRFLSPGRGMGSQRSVRDAREVVRAAFRRLLRSAMIVLPDHLYLFLAHRRSVGRFPNIANPKTFNEVILNRCLHPDPRWKALADKLEVREYVKERVGEKYLIPLIAAPEVFTKEVFDALPDSFVMKANHGSGFVEIVRDKSKSSFETLNRIANRWLAIDYYRVARERHYRGIKPRLFFEALLRDREGKIPPDFKLNIFSSAPAEAVIYTGVVSDRFGDARGDVYDGQWNQLDFALGDYGRSETPLCRPENWEEVTRVALELAKGFGYVRVDLYLHDNNVYFGELTFTPGAGLFRYSPDWYDQEWGRLARRAVADNFSGNRPMGNAANLS